MARVDIINAVFNGLVRLAKVISFKSKCCSSECNRRQTQSSQSDPRISRV